MLRLLLPSVTLCTLAGALAVTGVRAQTDLDAGKSGPQLFAQDCVACHRSPQGLLKNTSSFGLVGFLRQHYTSSAASANTLGAYIMSVANARPPADPKKGKAADPQQQAKQTPPAREPRPGAVQPPEAAQAHARPGEPAADPSDRTNRRPRRPGSAETATTPAAPEPTTTAARPEAPAESAAPPAPAQQTAAAPQAAPPPAPAEPGFAEPLP